MKKLMKKTTSEQEKQPIGMCEQNFKIYLRIKPITTPDTNNQVLKIINNTKVEITSPYYSVNEIQKLYTYQQVFDDSVNNSKVFQQTMITPIANVLQGFNSTVFIYGMTGSGKTYTMFGSLGSGTQRGRAEEDGLVSMTLDYMFNEIQKQPHVKSQIVVSFYQIYNENIRDLLQQDCQLTIMEDPIRGVFINGLTEVLAQQKNQIKDIIFSGIDKRSMNATRSNEVSSRSHAILQFIVKRYFNSQDNQPMVLESKFFMIDLAGNQKTSNNESRRFIEGVNINKSLLTLGKCLSILAEKSTGYVPFRDSKLTRILKQSLGGNSKTVMIACVSSERKFYQQTLNTLKYSTIAKKIKNKGIKNNLKAICKQDIPDPRNFVNGKTQLHHQHNGQVQKRVKGILETFLAAVQAKLKIEKLQQDLEQSRKQNEQLLCTEDGDVELCKRNIKRINDTLQMLIRPYQKQLEKLESSYHELMKNVQAMMKQKKVEAPSVADSNIEISRLKEIITSQNKKIVEFQHKMSSFSDLCAVEPEAQQFEKVANKSLDYHHQVKLASPALHKQNSVPVFNVMHLPHTTQRNLSKNKKLTINCGETEENSRSSPLKVLNNSNLSSTNSRIQKKSSKFQKEIVINLNSDHLQKKSHQSSRDQFVKRLKQTEKKAKGIESEQISSLLKQQETNRYDLGNTEMSMIRKLKFFQREKSMEKSNSVGKVLNIGRLQMKKY